MAAERSTYVRRALFALAGLVVVVVLASLVSSLRPDNTFRLRMYTDTLAGGIGEGTGVVVNGAEIGTVRTITPTRTGEFVVDLAMDPDRLKTPGIISTTTRLTYAPKNLFGIAAVVLDSVPGGEPIASGGDFHPDTPADATLTSMLRQLSDMQNKAFDPYIGDLLNKADRASMAFMPVLDIMGRLTGALVNTEQIPVEVTLPKMSGLVQGLPAGVDNLMTSLNGLMAWPAARNGGQDFLNRLTKGVNLATEVSVPLTGQLLGPKALGQLMPLMPQLLPVLETVLKSFPDARKNGLQIRQLIYNLNRALPIVGGRPVLKVDVVLRGMPGPVSGLTGGVR